MDTLYWCKIFRAPILQDKHHIVGYEALLTKDRYYVFLNIFLAAWNAKMYFLLSYFVNIDNRGIGKVRGMFFQ